MAINPRTNRHNKNAVYLATSGGGKSQAVRSQIRKARADYVIAWDPDDDHDYLHPIDRLSTMRDYLADRYASGRPVKVAYTGPCSREYFEAFCRLAWACLDGRHPTHIIIEEMADVTGTAKASDGLGQLMRRGRKYGAIIHATSQRSAEIPKTVISQCATVWAGIHYGERDRARVADWVGVRPEQIADLSPLEFYIREGVKTRRQKVKYIK